jgi:hypothetical protein
MATAKKTTSAKSAKASPKKATSRAKPKTTRAKKGTQTRKGGAGRAVPKGQSRGNAPKTKPVEQPTGPVRYAARNLTGYEFGFRLERQSDKNKKRTDLKPRGQRGDFVLLQEGDLEDPALQDQVNVGAVEIITATEAAKIAKKQTTNQQRVHPALALLRNEYGEEYEEGAFSTAQTFEDQGVVVAELHDGQVAVDRGGIVRPGREPEPERGRSAQQRLRRPGKSPMVTQSPQTIRRRDIEERTSEELRSREGGDRR